MSERDDDDALQALDHAEELKRQREEEDYQKLLRDDPGYLAWLAQLEREDGTREG